MRASRFVDELGTAARAAALNVAEAAEVTASHRGGLEEAATTSDRVGAELLRQLTRETDDRPLERVSFDAETHGLEGSGSGPGFDIALSIGIDLPAYRANNCTLGTVIHASELPTGSGGPDPEALRSEIDTLLDRSPATYLFVVGDEEIRVLPARSVNGLTVPLTASAIETHVYGRSLRRFVEALAEGFLGVTSFDGQSRDGVALTDWGREAGLDGVYRLQVSREPERTESSLASFLEGD